MIVSLLGAGGCALGLGLFAGGCPGGEVGSQARVPLEEAGGRVLHPHQPLALGISKFDIDADVMLIVLKPYREVEAV